MSKSTERQEEKKIGNVQLIYSPSMEVATYEDGAEKRLHAIFQQDDFAAEVAALLKDPSLDWPMEYHLSPQRQFLLNWFPFDKNATVLEVGAGCGAITGAFIDAVDSVTAVELIQQRAEIIAHRYRDKKNLRVIAGNINDVIEGELFDYVTCIGVLEYAGKYIDHPQPVQQLLATLKSRLKPGGTLLLAIENAFGLKYWSGAAEDHTAQLFDSIEGYVRPQGIQTFGRKELEDLLNTAGFAAQNWYYPLPDYKMPVEIFSDNYLPTPGHYMRMDLYPARDYGRDREVFFDEQRAWAKIVQEGQFPFFANAFLIAASIA